MIVVKMRLVSVIEYDALHKREKQEWPFAEVSESTLYLVDRPQRRRPGGAAAMRYRWLRLPSN